MIRDTHDRRRRADRKERRGLMMIMVVAINFTQLAVTHDHWPRWLGGCSYNWALCADNIHALFYYYRSPCVQHAATTLSFLSFPHKNIYICILYFSREYEIYTPFQNCACIMWYCSLYVHVDGIMLSLATITACTAVGYQREKIEIISSLIKVSAW